MAELACTGLQCQEDGVLRGVIGYGGKEGERKEEKEKERRRRRMRHSSNCHLVAWEKELERGKRGDELRYMERVARPRITRKEGKKKRKNEKKKKKRDK